MREWKKIEGFDFKEIIFRLRKKSMQRCLAMQPIEPLA